MRTVYERELANATKIERNLLQGTANICISPFGLACKGMWPHKTAEELAARSGCTVRAAAYQISGESEPSARSINAINSYWLTRK